MKKEKTKSKIQCQKCKYIWFTTSKLRYVSCPNCMSKVLNEGVKNETN